MMLAERRWMSPPMTSKTRSTPADGFKILVVEVEELVRPEVERRLAVRRADAETVDWTHVV
jgi:hypothetical protein